MNIKWPLIIVASAVISASALLIAMVTEFAPRFVWNVTPSAPVGLYRIAIRQPNFGEYVLVLPSDRIEKLIANRDYLPPGTPLIKRVSALVGDEICRFDEHILVNKTHIADALLEDSLERSMPIWSGCLTLKSDEFFLLNSHEKSLDGRYFGATNTQAIIGVAIPILVKEMDA